MAINAGTSESRRSFLGVVLNREPSRYPDRGPRMALLLLVVAITVVLYYELYVGCGVAPLMLGALRMSFGLITLFAVPNVTMPLRWAVTYGAVSVMEGVILIAASALIRDLSPQVGRAAAMGFWTVGPVLGSLRRDAQGRGYGSGPGPIRLS